MVCVEKKMKVLICKFGDWYAYVCDNDYLLIELGSQQKFEKLTPKRVFTLLSKIKDLKKKKFHIEAICGKRINNEILKIILKRYISYISGEIKVENLYVLKHKTVGDLINELKPKQKKLTNFEIKLIEAIGREILFHYGKIDLNSQFHLKIFYLLNSQFYRSSHEVQIEHHPDF